MGVRRVSTRDQNPQLQLDALEASGYDTLVQEKESGKRGVLRPAWQDLLPLPQPGDTLKFWKSDRWGRSAADVLATVNQLRDRGVTVVSLTENFDLATQCRCLWAANYRSVTGSRGHDAGYASVGRVFR